MRRFWTIEYYKGRSLHSLLKLVEYLYQDHDRSHQVPVLMANGKRGIEEMYLYREKLIVCQGKPQDHFHAHGEIRLNDWQQPAETHVD
jgi:hypothetical protein